MGLHKIPYWLANYAFDFIVFTIPLVLFFILIFILGDSTKFLTEVTQYLVPLLLLFSFSFISYSYFFSFIFQKSSTAYRFFPFLNLIFFYTLPQIPQFIEPDGALAQYVMPGLSPFLAFSNSFFTKQILGDVDIDDKIFRCKSLEFNYVALAVQAVVFASATLFFESIRFNLKDRQNV